MSELRLAWRVLTRRKAFLALVVTVLSAGLGPAILPPARGRHFSMADSVPGAPPVVLISDELWRTRYHARADIVGRLIRVNSEPATVVGIMPPRFAFPHRQRLWLPLPDAPPGEVGDASGAILVARLAARFSLEGLLSGALSRLERQISPYRDARGMDPGLFAARFDLRFQTIYTAALSLSVLGGALMLGLLFRGQRRPMGAHLIFMLHYISFLYLLSAGVGIFTFQTRQGPALTLMITVVALYTYLSLALHRVYRERPLPTLLKTAAMIAFAFVLDGLVSVGAMLLTLRTV